MKNYKIFKSRYAILVIGIISVLSTFLSVAIQPGSIRESVSSLCQNPLTILLNYLPVLVLILFFYLLINNAFWGCAAASCIISVASYVNLLKIEGRDDVFVPADIFLFREAFAAATEYNLNMHWKWIFIIVIYTVLLCLLGVFIRIEKIELKKRGIAGIGLCVITFLLMKNVYSSSDLYYSFPVAETYNIPMRFNTLGFNYSFLHNFNLYPVEKPEGYNKKTVQKWEEEHLGKEQEQEVKPNVIMVMCEAFSDLANEDVFLWESEEQNPIHEYNKIANSDRAIAGHIVVSNIYAGTANTEFDVLTGMPTNMIAENTTSAFRVVNRDTKSVASLLRENGYRTTLIHPGDSWFYNRDNVYHHFGVDNRIFNERFDLENDIWGSYVSDEAFLREVKKVIEAETAPFFMYGVTIQNHQSYSYYKYVDETSKVPVSKEISDQAMELLSVYLRGTRDSSKMLLGLTEYIDSLEEPTILVFFGDHLPNLGAENGAYRELGLSIGKTDTVQSIIDTYTTPYLIYGNTSYCQKLDFEALEKSLNLPKNGTFSDIYLGATVLEMLGYTGQDAYFDFLSYARRELPVFKEKENAYLLGDGSVITELSETQKEIIHKIDWWEYYRLRDK